VSAAPEKLVQMANQIARFFDAQSGDAATQTMHHIHSFWAPSMRRVLVEFLHNGGQGLGLTARKAAELLADESGVRKAAHDPNAGSNG
jgi:formate dehydrogenase subunit delta